MEYEQFESIFNNTIFEKSKSDLIRKIATYPERYVGLFRPTKPKTKIIQNLLQSHEIRFGDAFELLIEEYLNEFGFSILNKKFVDGSGKYLEVDQMFSSENDIFFVEQKVRDDHDSSKKRGQIDNFEKKVEAILENYSGQRVEGFFYFIDASFHKNKNFYAEKIQELSNDYGVPLHLLYGNELFNQIGIGEIWNEMLNHLTRWKNNIPDLPEINFDKNPEESFAEIKQLKTIEYRKLLSNPALDDLLCVLFPERTTLALLTEHFARMYQDGQGQIYNTLHDLCADTINRLENN